MRQGLLATTLPNRVSAGRNAKQPIAVADYSIRFFFSSEKVNRYKFRNGRIDSISYWTGLKLIVAFHLVNKDAIEVVGAISAKRCFT